MDYYNNTFVASLYVDRPFNPSFGWLEISLDRW